MTFVWVASFRYDSNAFPPDREEFTKVEHQENAHNAMCANQIRTSSASASRRWPIPRLIVLTEDEQNTLRRYPEDERLLSCSRSRCTVIMCTPSDHGQIAVRAARAGPRSRLSPLVRTLESLKTSLDLILGGTWSWRQGRESFEFLDSVLRGRPASGTLFATKMPPIVPSYWGPTGGRENWRRGISDLDIDGRAGLQRA